MSATVTATMRSLSARGDVSCLRVGRGPHRKLSVVLSGFCAERIRVTYTAPGNSVYAAYRRTITYTTREVR